MSGEGQMSGHVHGRSSLESVHDTERTERRAAAEAADEDAADETRRPQVLAGKTTPPRRIRHEKQL